MRKIIDKLLKRKTGEINIPKLPKIVYKKEFWFPSPDLKNLKRKESINNIFYKKNF